MKHLLLTTIAAVVLVGCGPSVDIHLAAREGNIEAVKQAIDDGADLNAKDNVNMTPLHWAANGGHKEIVELLITNGANVNARTPRMVGWHTPLHDAAAAGHKEVAELLIAEGADVNAKDSTFGRTLLHIAAREGHKEIVELLLAKGVDVNPKDKEGKTPLDAAIYGKNPQTADLLRKHGGKTGAELKAEGK